METVFKIYLKRNEAEEPEVRRLRVAAPDSQSLAALCARAQAVFSTGDLALQYEDEDGDLIMITTDVELEDAISASRGATIKLFASPKKVREVAVAAPGVSLRADDLTKGAALDAKKAEHAAKAERKAAKANARAQHHQAKAEAKAAKGKGAKGASAEAAKADSSFDLDVWLDEHCDFSAFESAETPGMLSRQGATRMLRKMHVRLFHLLLAGVISEEDLRTLPSEKWARRVVIMAERTRVKTARWQAKRRARSGRGQEEDTTATCDDDDDDDDRHHRHHSPHGFGFGFGFGHGRGRGWRHHGHGHGPPPAALGVGAGGPWFGGGDGGEGPRDHPPPPPMAPSPFGGPPAPFVFGSPHDHPPPPPAPAALHDPEHHGHGHGEGGWRKGRPHSHHHHHRHARRGRGCRRGRGGGRWGGPQPHWRAFADRVSDVGRRVERGVTSTVGAVSEIVDKAVGAPVRGYMGVKASAPSAHRGDTDAQPDAQPDAGTQRRVEQEQEQEQVPKTPIDDGEVDEAVSAREVATRLGAPPRLERGGSKRQMVRFIKHAGVDTRDPLPVEAGASFTKTWRVRNDGAEAWPVDCMLVPVGGDVDAIEVHQLPRMAYALSIGAETDLTVQLVAPARAGAYTVHWRMLDCRTGKRFGGRIWLSLQVRGDPATTGGSSSGSSSSSGQGEGEGEGETYTEEDPDAPAAAAAAASREATRGREEARRARAAAKAERILNGRFAAEFVHLQEMGLVSEFGAVRCARKLVKFTGNVERVVQDLM